MPPKRPVVAARGCSLSVTAVVLGPMAVTGKIPKVIIFTKLPPLRSFRSLVLSRTCDRAFTENDGERPARPAECLRGRLARPV